MILQMGCKCFKTPITQSFILFKFTTYQIVKKHTLLSTQFQTIKCQPIIHNIQDMSQTCFSKTVEVFFPHQSFLQLFIFTLALVIWSRSLSLGWRKPLHSLVPVVCGALTSDRFKDWRLIFRTIIILLYLIPTQVFQSVRSFFKIFKKVNYLLYIQNISIPTQVHYITYKLEMRSYRSTLTDSSLFLRLCI